MTLFDELLVGLKDIGNLERETLKNELIQLAKDESLDIANADIEDIRKLASLYIQKVATQSVEN